MGAWRIVFCLAAVVCLAASATLADIPTLINYQGKLADAAGTPLTGMKPMVFEFYDDPTGGNLIGGFSESRDVAVTNGIFNVLVGSSTVGGVPAAIFESKKVFLSVQVDTEELKPRQRIVSVPFAYKAAKADNADEANHANTADNASMLEGKTASAFARNPHDHWGEIWNGNGTGLTLNSDIIGLMGSVGESGLPLPDAGVVGNTERTVGVAGLSALGVGMWGESQSGTGVLGYSASGWGVNGISLNTSGEVYAGRFEGNSHLGGALMGVSSAGKGVYGLHTDATLVNPAVYGKNEGRGAGVQGDAFSTAGSGLVGRAFGSGAGVHGNSVSGTGVYGKSDATEAAEGEVYGGDFEGNSHWGGGVRGVSSRGSGVYGLHTDETYVNPGVLGINEGAGDGVLGHAYGTDDAGVLGRAFGTGAGVRGQADGTGAGVFGLASGSGAGVEGQADGTGAGVEGQADGTGAGGVFSSDKGSGVEAVSSEGIGVYGRHIHATYTEPAVCGENEGSGPGVMGDAYATDGTGHGVIGRAFGTGAGVKGEALGSGAGVEGASSEGIGVYGLHMHESSISPAVYGRNEGRGSGVQGDAYYNDSTSAGVVGRAFGIGAGLHGYSAKGPAVHADGYVIANRYAYHSPRVHYYTIGGEAFQPGSNVPYSNFGIAGACIHAAGAHSLNAPVDLPHGAKVTSFKVFFNDTSESDMAVLLYRFGLAEALDEGVAHVESEGATGYYSKTDNTISDATSTIDKLSYSYNVHAFSHEWNPGLRIMGAVITYEINEAP